MKTAIFVLTFALIGISCPIQAQEKPPEDGYPPVVARAFVNTTIAAGDLGSTALAAAQRQQTSGRADQAGESNLPDFSTPAASRKTALNLLATLLAGLLVPVLDALRTARASRRS